ncbi:MAG: hypothetical protein V4787_17435 [Pseudomonadota bacterium]
MRKLLPAILLCALATVAIAQTTAPSPSHAPRPASRHATAPSASARPTPDIIKAAGAATHDQVEQAPARQQAATDGEDHSHSGKAMLLAALAVMAGIALRRFSRQK